MKKGIGPRGLGAPKSAAKMYGKSPAKKMQGMMKPDASPAKDYKKGYYGK